MTDREEFWEEGNAQDGQSEGSQGSGGVDGMGGMSEAELLRRAKKGDPDAFTEILAREQPRLWRRCLSLMGDEFDAEELLQDVRIEAWRKIGRFRGKATVGTWLWRLSWCLYVDRIRKERRRKEDSFDLIEEVAVAGQLGTYTDGLSSWQEELPDEWLIVLSRLSCLQRKALELFYIEGNLIKEVAQKLEIRVDYTKKLLSRGRDQIRDEMDKRVARGRAGV